MNISIRWKLDGVEPSSQPNQRKTEKIRILKFPFMFHIKIQQCSNWGIFVCHSESESFAASQHVTPHTRRACVDISYTYIKTLFLNLPLQHCCSKSPSAVIEICEGQQMKFQATITNPVCVLYIFFPPPKVGHLCYQWFVSTGRTISTDLAAGRKQKNAHLKLYWH